MDGRGGGGGGRGGKEFFLSSHRCPEVDLLPSCSLRRPAGSELSCNRAAEAKYLEVSSTCHSEEEEEEGPDVDEEEESISDWSEEDLSLHFSPSVIDPSEDEESGPESGFECVDVSMETLVKGHREGSLKMVPKRQIQLKKKETEKPQTAQVLLKDIAAGTAVNTDSLSHQVSVQLRPDLLRQHSLPASLHPQSQRSGASGATEGFHVGGNSRQRLQKSFSLDETKTKMASCIIMSALAKKMQLEQSSSKTYELKKPVSPPGLLQPTEQQRGREGGGARVSGGVARAPVHVVRDMRSLVKNKYRHSFFTAPAPENNKATNFKVISQEGSPPPTYQQAVGVKGHEDMKRSRHITAVNTSLSQSHDRTQSNRLSHLIAVQRAGRADVGPSPHPPHSSPPRSTSGTSLSVQKLSTSQTLLQAPTPGPPQRETCPPQRETCPDVQTRTTAETPAAQEQLQLQGFLPAQVGSDTLPKLTASAAAAAAASGARGSAPPHIMIDPTSGQYFYVDAPPQRKLLLDPETGQFVQVFLPAAGFAPSTGVIPARRANPAPFSPCVINPAPFANHVIHPFPFAPRVMNPAPFGAPVIGSAPTVLSVMQFHPTVAVSSLFAPSCLPLPLHTPSHDFTPTAQR